jgi:hydrogenase-4 membrane subunit HyfE
MSNAAFSAPLALAGFALLALAAASLLTRDPRQNVRLYALAAVPQAGIAALLGALYDRPELYGLALAILVFKGLAAPRLLTVPWPPEERARYGASGQIGTPSTLIVVVGLFLFAFHVAGYLSPPPVTTALAAALAAGLAGLAAPAVRHELSAQAAGLLQAEAGISSAALLLVGHLPVVPDVISLAELLVLALLLGVLLATVARVHGTADARRLQELRG